jgi:hypothetical protein
MPALVPIHKNGLPPVQFALMKPVGEVKFQC